MSILDVWKAICQQYVKQWRSDERNTKYVKLRNNLEGWKGGIANGL